MPFKILVPLKDVQTALNSSLVLDHPPRCSRCGAATAEYFETHRLRLRAGQKPGGYYRPKYRLDKSYLLKVRVCSDCYQADFLTAPEELKADGTPLGRKSRFHSLLLAFGGVIAALGVLLLTPLTPAVGILITLKAFWQLITLAGLVVVLAAWLVQRNQQKKVNAEFAARGITIENRARTEVRTPVLADAGDPASIPLEIGFKDETWARECAQHYQWSIEPYNANLGKGEEK